MSFAHSIHFLQRDYIPIGGPIPKLLGYINGFMDFIAYSPPHVEVLTPLEALELTVFECSLSKG